MYKKHLCMKKMFIILILNIPLVVYSQNNLEGIVLDSINHQPVPFATVFINGTSKGTYTDTSGIFIIKNAIFPSQVVVSNVAYIPKMIYVENNDQKIFTIFINKKGILLSEVVVVSDNIRPKNIIDFKRWYIGSDYWGKNAILRNDSSLVFNRELNYNKVNILRSSKHYIITSPLLPRDIIEWAKDSSYAIVKKIASLKAVSKTPLIIDMPLLGYILHVDLIDFTYKYGESIISSLAYYYWKPYYAKKEQETKLFERNRQKAYYNSKQHFCRSLYANKLEQNGYRLFEQIINEKTHMKELRYVNIDTCFKYINGNEMQIFGLKNKHFIIHYFFNLIGKPIDLTKRGKGLNFRKSEISFLSDTCTIRSDGIIPNSSIMFGGKISEKRAGALLPYDYILSEIE